MAADNFIQAVSDIILVQSLARRLKAMRVLRRLKDEMHLLRATSSTKISSTWRRFFAVREYNFSIAGKRIEVDRFLFMTIIKAVTQFTVYSSPDIIVCQSVVRRKLAATKTERLRQERREYCATLIQATWRRCMAADNFIQAVSDIILIQAIARRCSALKVSRRLKEEKQKLREASSTKISSTWRRFFAIRDYRCNVAGKPFNYCFGSHLPSVRSTFTFNYLLLIRYHRLPICCATQSGSH